jgi:hypothetical protein
MILEIPPGTRMSAPCQPSRHSASGSALVLTLLITALLATIVVSFLSTSRVEMMAARNFSRQTAASGLAELATQQAMAKIQLGFNTTANMTGNYTSVVTTQPGAIHKYFFQNGTMTWNSTVEQFSAGNMSINGTVTPLSASTSNATVYLNNLESSSSNSSATSNQWTITGNASERINVFMENVTTTVNGTNQTVGRIAYYVDDEGSKLNLNAATGDRPTLNIGSSRSLSLSTLASPTQATNFTQTINGTTNTPSSIQNWAHFFRPEQLAGLFGGDAAISGNLSKFSAAPIAGSDYHLKKTPWGTDRLFINDLPIDSTGVDDIYNALSSSQLRDIYGTTFAEKYTDAGLKQIAANILQARDPNVLNDPTKSFTYNGSLLGAANATTDLVAIADCCANATATKVIPKDYLGNAPYPILNEIGVTVTLSFFQTGGSIFPRFYVRPFISIFNPWKDSFPAGVVSNWTIEMQIDAFNFLAEHKLNGVTYGPFKYGPTGYKNSDAWGHSYNESKSNTDARNWSAIAGQIGNQFNMAAGFLHYPLNGNSTVMANGDIPITLALPSYAKELGPGEELQFPCPPFHNSNQLFHGFRMAVGNTTDTAFTDISDIVIKFEYIRLVAKSGNNTIIRDWVLAEDLEVEGWLQAPHPDFGWPKGFPEGIPFKNLDLSRRYVSRENTKPPQYSIKRIGGALRTAANMRVSSRNSTQAWSESGNATWVNPNASGSASSTSTTGNAEAYPSTTQNNEIPGDPTMTDSDLRYAFDPREHHLDSNDWPKIEFTNPANTTGVFTSPADLGKIQTNIQHRKLRFTTQHPKEVAGGSGGLGNATYIPDWAMLDVISFGSNTTIVPLPAPLNLNGRFYVPSGSPQPAPRTAGLESALKAIDSANSLGNSFNANFTVSTNRSQYMGSSGNVSSTIAGNIGNLTWSSGNFTTGNATWGKGNATNDAPGGTSSRRKTANFPANQFVLPSEVTEIRGVSDVVRLDNYTGNSTHIKANEGRLSSLFPGATTQSRFFTIYAFAQALDRQGQPDSEAVTKTLVEVEEQTPVTVPPTYKVKKLYTQPISVQ